MIVASPSANPAMEVLRKGIGAAALSRPNNSNATPTKTVDVSGSENSHAEYAKIGVPRPTMVVANRATRAGIPIPISSRKKKVTVSAENVALLKHEENATTKSVSSAGTPGNRANRCCPMAYQGAQSKACPGGYAARGCPC